MLEAIHTTCQNQTRHVSAQGDLRTEPHQRQFISYLESGGAERVEVMFLDAAMLPGAVVEALLRFRHQNPKIQLRLSVFHRYLYSYLYRLGLPVKMAPRGERPPPRARTFRALALGGSAGSLDKLMEIVRALPRSPASVFIIQHVPEDQPNYLDSILAPLSKYTITPVRDGLAVQPGCLYIAPPGKQMRVSGGLVRLSDEDRCFYARPSIHVLFESLAHEYGPDFLAVLLCGYGEDGPQVLPLIRQHHGLTVIEDPADDEANHLLLRAWETGAVDYKFPLPELTLWLSRMLAPPDIEVPEGQVGGLLEALWERYGYDYRDYDRESIKRRIRRAMQQGAFHSFQRFQESVLQDREVFEDLFLECSINVTEFFRDPGQLRLLREQVLPYLDSFPYLRVWSAGCSTGQEAVSLAILLKECGMLAKSRIYATDINPYVIQEAQSGFYAPETLAASRDHYAAAGGSGRIEDHFVEQWGVYSVDPALQDRLIYMPHSLLNPAPLNEFQLILCRNVLIYFNSSLRQRVMDLFNRSLDLNGFILLGDKEPGDLGAAPFQPLAPGARVYRKTETH